MIRIGIIGCGRIVEVGHVTALVELRRLYRVVALADPSEERRRTIGGMLTAAGLIGGMGYLGAMLSGYGVGVLVQRGGWGAAFAALAGVSGLSLLTAWGFGRAERGRDGPD